MCVPVTPSQRGYLTSCSAVAIVFHVVICINHESVIRHILTCGVRAEFGNQGSTLVATIFVTD